VPQNNTVTQNKVCLISWISRGSNEQKLQFAKFLVSPQVVGNKIPILCNQENFILKSNTYRLFQAIPGFQFIINPAIKTIQDQGRPKNGMFICFPDSIKSCVRDVSPGHWRVQAVVISSAESRTLLINTYFPFDKREGQYNNNNDDELTETIGIIQNVIRSTECDAVAWVGDINADFSRNNRQSNTVSEAVSESNLCVTWERYPTDFTHTYEREGTTHVSTLDHFFLSEQLMNTVCDAGVLHHPDNSSDHEPVYCVFTSITISQSSVQPASRQPHPSWRRANMEEKKYFDYLLDTRLESIAIPSQVTECRNLHCKDEVHLEAIDWHTAEVLEAVQAAGEGALPCPKAGSSKERRKVTPGFNVRVKPFKETAYFWSAVWKSAGSPLNTHLHTIMKRTRNRYHLEFKKCQKAELTIRKSKLLDACLNGNGNLFKEIKAMRKSKPKVADSIDGVKEDLSKHFRNIYSELYNCVNDGNEVKQISAEIEAKLTCKHLKDIDKVTPEEIKKAAVKLKPGKSDPVYTFSSDCLKTNSALLAEHTASMIKIYLVHGHIPQFMLISTLVPIIKDKLGSINISKNYRSVCITSLILKQLDWVTLNLFGESLKFHDLQFAYQPGVSATMCSWAVIETVNYFLRNGSDVFGCSQDKSKAFDLCKFSILFRKMMGKISLIFLRLIIFMYLNQFCNVNFNNEISSSFSIGNGVGQGKILAGFAYCFYCHGLFEILESSGFGCTINGIYAGIFGYSDDDLVLSPTISGLQCMITITEEYCTSHGLKFSTDPDPIKSKTKCISWMRVRQPLPKMRLCGHLLPWVDKIVHLGNTITDKIDIVTEDMNIKRARYISKNIEINQEFHFAAAETVLWDLCSPAAIRLESSYNRSMKVMMNLPLATHRELIEPLSQRQHVKTTFLRRFLQMTKKMRESEKPILRTLLSTLENNTSSTTGRNLRSILLITNKSSIHEVDLSDVENLVYRPVEEEREWRVELVELLLVEREQGGLEDSDLEWLEWLCTD
jgi:hypothetical protein